MADLATIQRRFYELVTAGEGTVEAGLITGAPRLEVYAGSYVARLADILAADHPKLRAALGGEAFHDLAADYVRACPPLSFTVRDAGIRLADYLATRDDLPPWAADLARIERARVEVFDGPDAATLTRDALSQVPIEAFPGVELALVPSSLVVRIAWTVDELWSTIEDEAQNAAPRPCERAVLVWRRELRVVHRTLDDDEAELAQLLARGASAAELSTRLAERATAAPEQRLVELLSRWLEAEALRAFSPSWASRA